MDEYNFHFVGAESALNEAEQAGAREDWEAASSATELARFHCEQLIKWAQAKIDEESSKQTKLKQKHKGSHAEWRAALWLLEQGLEVFLNVSRHGVADMVAWNEETGEFIAVDVTSSETASLYKVRDIGERPIKVLLADSKGIRFITKAGGTSSRVHSKRPKKSPANGA